jgi:CHAD domain-containing protein
MNTPPNSAMRKFAHERVGALLDQTAFQLANVVRTGDEEAVHKMRVSIRRLQQALRLFVQYLDEGRTAKLRRQLRELMKAAAEVRNRDVGGQLLAGMGAPQAMLDRLEAERREWMIELRGLARMRAPSGPKWRARLQVN